MGSKLPLFFTGLGVVASGGPSAAQLQATLVQQEEVAKNQEQLYYINDPYDILSSSQKTELIQYAKRLSCKLVVSVGVDHRLATTSKEYIKENVNTYSDFKSMIDDHKIDKKKIDDQVNKSDLVFIGISVPNNSQSKSGKNVYLVVEVGTNKSGDKNKSLYYKNQPIYKSIASCFKEGGFEVKNIVDAIKCGIDDIEHLYPSSTYYPSSQPKVQSSSESSSSAEKAQNPEKPVDLRLLWASLVVLLGSGGARLLWSKLKKTQELSQSEYDKHINTLFTLLEDNKNIIENIKKIKQSFNSIKEYLPEDFVVEKYADFGQTELKNYLYPVLDPTKIVDQTILKKRYQSSETVESAIDGLKESISTFNTHKDTIENFFTKITSIIKLKKLITDTDKPRWHAEYQNIISTNVDQQRINNFLGLDESKQQFSAGKQGKELFNEYIDGLKSNVDKLLSTIKGTPTPVQVEPYDHAFSNFDYNHPLYASISDYEHTTILSALENADKMINIDGLKEEIERNEEKTENFLTYYDTWIKTINDLGKTYPQLSQLLEKGDNNLENKGKDIASLYIEFQNLYLYTKKKQYNLINQSIDDITRKCDEYLGYYQEFKEKKEKCIGLMNEIQELSQKIELYSSGGIYSKMVDPGLYESIKGNYETQKNNFDPTRYPDFFSLHDALSVCKKALDDLLGEYTSASEYREGCKRYLSEISKKYNAFQKDINRIYNSLNSLFFPYPTIWEESDMDTAQDFKSLSQELETTINNQQKNQDLINSIIQKNGALNRKNNEYQKLKGHPYAKTYTDSTDYTTITLSGDLSNDLQTLQQKYDDLEDGIKSITKYISDNTPSSSSGSNNDDWTSHSHTSGGSNNHTQSPGVDRSSPNDDDNGGGTDGDGGTD